MEWTVLFMGPVGAGKTEAIRSLSDIDVLDTDVMATDETDLLKEKTTIEGQLRDLETGKQELARMAQQLKQDTTQAMKDLDFKRRESILQIKEAEVALAGKAAALKSA